MIAFCAFFVIQFTYAQHFNSDFDDGTLQGWTNTDTSTSGMTAEEDAGFFYLQKDTHGGSTPSQNEMAIVNEVPEFWGGNHFYEHIDGTALRQVIIRMRNQNPYDLHLRFSYEGANGYRVVTTDAEIVPAQSDWFGYFPYFNIETHQGQFIYDNITILTDTTGIPPEEVFNNVVDLFENVVEFRVLHNEALSYHGAEIEGILEVDHISSHDVLSVEEQLEASFKIFPNPAINTVQVVAHIEMEYYAIYNLLGAKVAEGIIETTRKQIDVSSLISGVYLLQLVSETGKTFTHKMVKN